MVKIVTLFLAGIILLALVGRFVLGGRSSLPRKPPRDGIGTFRKCPDCGRYRLDGTTCGCGAAG